MLPELEVCRRLHLPTLYWPRLGDDPKEWKGPHEKGWNDPARVYDLRRYDPAIHNVGTFTGREISDGRYLVDVDFDRLNKYFAASFFPPSELILSRPGKELSHVFYTTGTAPEGKVEYHVLGGSTPYIELRGTRHQTMIPPSLHTPPDIRVQFKLANEIGHVDQLATLEDATLNYAIACLVADAFPDGLHHDDRLALVGYLLKSGFDEARVLKIIETVCAYQIRAGVPDMSDYDGRDARKIVETTVARLKNRERVKGYSHLKTVNEDFAKRLHKWINPRLVADGNVNVDDFYAYMPSHSYLFIPSREFWPASSVNSRIPPIPTGNDDKGKPETMSANVWLDRHRAVEQMTWAPGFPMLIRDKLVSDGGWIDRPGCSCINLYRGPQVVPGDAAAAGPWLDLVRKVYPEDADHVVAWLAHRVQRPHEKVNHALVFGGVPGIGKDTILEPVKSAIGAWNFSEVSPSHLLGRFNGFVKSVILRISEARDLGEINRFSFYEHMKVYTAAPPDVLRVDEKNIREYSVFNVCGVIITTNHQTDGIYLPPEDRRHYVAWSPVTPEDFEPGFWKSLYTWYANGGVGHVAAYLAGYDLSQFDPKAPPKKTDAFWAIVDANRSGEDAELADALDEAGQPQAVTLQLLADVAGPTFPELAHWLRDRKSARQIPHRMKTAGYVPHRNASAKDGLWKINGKRQAVYVRAELSVPEKQKAAEALGRSVGEVGEVSDPPSRSYDGLLKDG